MDVMRQYLERAPERLDRSIHMRFMWSPVQILGENGQVTGVVVERNRLVDDGNGSVRAEGTGDRQTIACGMVLRSVGYRSVALAGVPFDERRGLFPNVEGRLTDGPGGAVLPRTYVVGWAKRGPSGIIGTNKPDSVATVNSMKADWQGLSDLAAIHRDGAAVATLIANRTAQVVDYAGWQAIDAHEIATGAPQERPRVKLTRVADMLNVAKQR
jgi:ferredoxin--NADP+ reductase